MSVQMDQLIETHSDHLYAVGKHPEIDSIAYSSVDHFVRLGCKTTDTRNEIIKLLDAENIPFEWEPASNVILLTDADTLSQALELLDFGDESVAYFCEKFGYVPDAA